MIKLLKKELKDVSGGDGSPKPPTPCPPRGCGTK